VRGMTGISSPPDKKGTPGVEVAAKLNRRWPAMGVVVLAVVASSLIQTSHADAAKSRPKCLGKKATIVGTKKSNIIKGTKKADVIVGLGGNDRIIGGGGADRICGGVGADDLQGGKGNDRIDGGKGYDNCRQQAGTGPKKRCEGPKFQLAVTKAGTGAGKVASSPPGIDCGQACALGFIEGQSVTLTATASSGSTFEGW
jgi:hypothetical protein